ncbi:Putative ribonuclease H protein At1g65750 [Linum perenne]
MRDELCDVIEGMRLAWDKGVRKLSIQIDSKVAIAILSRDWEVTINHIYREANFAADYMANLGHELDFGIHVFMVPDTKLLYWLRYDLTSICLPRAINNTS